MVGDTKQTQSSQTNVDPKVPERPLDPTRNAQDIFGDTAGMTGVTQGAKQQSSAEPEDTIRDTTMIKGGVIQNPTQASPGGYPKSDVGTDEYNQQVLNGMSSVAANAANAANDSASEPTNTDTTPNSSPNPTTPEDVELTKDATISLHPDEHAIRTGVADDFGKQQNTRFVTTQDAPTMQPDNAGESDAVGGTTPDVRSDDDTLEMAQRAGFQTDEDLEHPQPLDAARDIDQAEQRIKSS